MNLLQMSFSGGILILVIAIIRAIAGNRLPKSAFLVLWTIAFLRLLIPFSVPSAFSVYSLMAQNRVVRENVIKAEEAVGGSTIFPGESDSVLASDDVLVSDSGDLPDVTALSDTVFPLNDAVVSKSENLANAGLLSNAVFKVIFIIYLTGLVSCGGFFLISYIKCLGKFKMSLPVRDGYGVVWLKEHPMKRAVSIRQSDMIRAPLTYGLFRPVILMPKDVDWDNREQLKYILMHEYVHICRLDAFIKPVAAFILCLHWFNPAVWMMYILFNRDMELSCDERVVKAFGEDSKASYANTLIHMEEKKSGLVPLYSSFSKNAIEERITAIMKIKKTSLGVMLFTIVLTAGVTALFATSAKSAPYEDSLKKALVRIPGEDFTQEESEKLFSLWIEDYETMTVNDYRDKMHKMTDEKEMLDLIDRFSNSELAYEINDDKEAEAMAAFNDYFFYVFEPLTAEKWKNREFSGYAADRIEGASVDLAVFEYTFSLHIVNGDNLTTGEYDDIRRQADAALCTILDRYTTEELCDEQMMRDSLDKEISRLEKELSRADLQIKIVDYFFRPVSEEMLEDLALHEEANKESEALWEETLSPYAPFGLEWTYISDYDGGEVEMTWQGKEVRGIFDEKEAIWITAHSGISTYSPDAVELYAVYENGELIGLRLADEEEMAAFNEDREASTAEMEIERERAVSGYLPATEAEYRSLLALRTPGYENMTVAEFNEVLLEYANKNHEGYERVLVDAGLNDYHAELSEEEKKFIALTVALSTEENTRMVQSLRTGNPEEACCYWNFYEDKEAEGAWCCLWYYLKYRISDKEKLTVKERDQCISEVRKEIETFWAETDLEQLLSMSEEEVGEQLNAIAAACSNELITVSITENDIKFEKMDERGYINY